MESMDFVHHVRMHLQILPQSTTIIMRASNHTSTDNALKEYYANTCEMWLLPGLHSYSCLYVIISSEFKRLIWKKNKSFPLYCLLITCLMWSQSNVFWHIAQRELLHSWAAVPSLWELGSTAREMTGLLWWWWWWWYQSTGAGWRWLS